LKTRLREGIHDSDEREIKRKRVKKARSRIKTILVIVLCAAAFTCFALSPVFNISVIEVEGSSHYSKTTLVDMLELSPGDNAFRYLAKDIPGLFMLRYTEEEERIRKACPYIKDVKVKFTPPAKVLVQVAERTPVGVLPYLGTSLLMDEEGYILEAAADNEYGLPVIKGIEFDRYELGKRPFIEKPETLDNAVRLINIINKEDSGSDFKIYNLINWIDLSDGQQICMLLDSRLVIKLGDLRDIRYKINMLKTIYEKNIKSTDKGMIDFTLSENPVFIPERQGV